MAETRAFNTVPLGLAGGTYESSSLPISAQRTVNMYPEINQGGISEAVLQPWPGLITLAGDFYSSSSGFGGQSSTFSNPDGSITSIAFDSDNNNLLMWDNVADTLYVMDGITGTVLDSFGVTIGGDVYIGYDRYNSNLIISSTSPAAITIYNGLSASVTSSFSVTTGNRGIAIDNSGNLLVANHVTNTIDIHAGITSTVSSSIDISAAEGNITNLTFDPGAGNAIFTGLTDNIYVLDGLTNTVLQTQATVGTSGQHSITLNTSDGSLIESNYGTDTTYAYNSEIGARSGKSGRGDHVFNGAYYCIVSQTLYSISSNGTKTSIGTIPGTTRCTFADNGTLMVICYGGVPLSYDGTTLTELTSITIQPTVVTYLNNQFIFDSGTGDFWVADAGLTTINGLNFANPESDPDELTAPVVFNQLLYLFSTNSIEVWDNTGVGNPPFERISEAIIEGIGCESPFGVTTTDTGIYFIGNDGIPYKVQSFQAIPIGGAAICREFQGYTRTNTIAYQATFDGQKFCVFCFPTDKRVWVFSETTEQWFELDHETDGQRYLGSTYQEAYKLRLTQSYVDGSILKLDFDTFKNQLAPIVRERTLSVIAGETFGKAGMSLEMSKMRISAESGVGINTGQGENPNLMVQPSYDGGRTWGQQIFIEMGRDGEFNKAIEWHKMKVFDRLVVRITFSDPVKFVLYSASIDIREAGH